MHKWMLGMWMLALAASVPGCDGDTAGTESPSRQEIEYLRAQVEAERAARVEAERRLAREREARERDRRTAQARLEEEARKSALATVVALVLVCFLAAAVVLIARERRIRRTMAAGVRLLLRQEDRYGP